MNKLTIGSLFAGIGGIELGLEKTGGFETAWQVEIDDYARKVLEKHWPSARRWDDVRTFPCWPCDVLTFGSPGQDISSANYGGKGLDGERSGLFFEAMRCVRTIRPRYAIMENVSALLFRWLGRVLWEFSKIGYDAEWDSLPASIFGAPHGRDRIFILAYPASIGRQADCILKGGSFETYEAKNAKRIREWPGRVKSGCALPNRVRWCPDSELCRMVDGLPDRLDRYRCLGNAVVPAAAEYIGNCILSHERNQRR